MSENKQSENTENTNDADSGKELNLHKTECHNIIKNSTIPKKDQKGYHKELEDAKTEDEVEAVMDKLLKAEELVEKESENTKPAEEPNTRNAEVDLANTAPTETTTVTAEPVDPILTKLDELADNPKWKRFIQIKAITGTLKEDPKDFNDSQIIALYNEFNQWLLAGEPAPKMSEAMDDAKAVMIEKIYRFKHLGKEKLRYITADGVMHGQDKDGEWNIPYTESKAKKLIEQAVATVPNPKLYIIGNKKYSVNDPSNFTKNFDDCCKKGIAGTL